MDISTRRVMKELLLYDPFVEDNIAYFVYKGKQIKIFIHKEYPFTAPIVFVSNIQVIYSPYRYPRRLWDTYIRHYKKCLCCDNITCPNNWGPSLSITRVVDEYLEFINTLKLIQKCIIFSNTPLFPDEILREIKSFIY